MLFKNADLGIILVLCLLTLLSFAPLCTNQFEFINLDDDLYVTANPHVRAGLSLASLWWNITSGDYSYHWHPLTWLTLQLDYELYGLEPWGYHLTNLVLHTASAVLLFVFLKQATKSRWLSALAAAFFAVHPLRVECVAWISDRKGVLSTWFWMLTLLAYAWYARRPGWLRYAAVVAGFIAGLLSKPTLVTLPCVLVLIDIWPLRRFRGDNPPYTGASARRLIVEKLPLLALALAFSQMFVHSQRELVIGWEKLPWLPRLHNALFAYASYLAKTIWPMDLGLHYPHALTTLPWTQVAGAAALLASVSAFALWQFRRQPYILIGWLWFLGTLTPVIGIVQLTDLSMADRWAYVPSIGLFIALVWSAGHYAKRWQIEPIACVIAGVLLAACVLITSIQVYFWRDSINVWERSLQVTAKNSFAHKMLGLAYLAKGDEAKAEHHLLESIRLDPTDITAHHRLGLMLLARQQYDLAGPLFAEVVRVTAPLPPHVLNDLRVQSLNALANVLLIRHDYKQATHYLNESLRLRPRDGGVYYNLGMAYLGQQRHDDALAALMKALEYQLSSKDHQVNALVSIGTILHTNKNDPAGARPYFERALQLDPNHAAAKRRLGR